MFQFMRNISQVWRYLESYPLTTRSRVGRPLSEAECLGYFMLLRSVLLPEKVREKKN